MFFTSPKDRRYIILPHPFKYVRDVKVVYVKACYDVRIVIHYYSNQILQQFLLCLEWFHINIRSRTHNQRIFALVRFTENQRNHYYRILSCLGHFPLLQRNTFYIQTEKFQASHTIHFDFFELFYWDFNLCAHCVCRHTFRTFNLNPFHTLQIEISHESVFEGYVRFKNLETL